MTTRAIDVSVIVPCKDEAGTVSRIVVSVSKIPLRGELIFVDGHSTDGTREAIRRAIRTLGGGRHRSWRIYDKQQPGRGKWDAVSYGMRRARGQALVIYDADMSVDPTVIVHVVSALVKKPSALVMGSRFIYPQEPGAMRLLNHTGNILFSWIFSLMVGSRITDTLCGTKALTRVQYQNIWHATKKFRIHDPYGDFTLLLGAAKLGMPIVEVPVVYRARVYGVTKISRFRDGMKLLVVLYHAMKDFRVRKRDATRS